MAIQRAILAATVLTGLLIMSRGCSIPVGGYKAPTLDWKMMNSDVVVHGVAKSKEPDINFPESDVYRVKFEVRCIYKGAPMNEIIWIDEVGQVPGHCHTTNLTVDEHYLVYLSRKDTGRFTLAFVQDPGLEDYLEEIIVLCETSISYPTGYSLLHNKEKCPEKSESDLEDCMPKPVPTTKQHEIVEVQSDPPPGDPVKEHPQNTKDNGEDVPYTPVKSEETIDDNGNGSVALTLGASALAVVMLSVLLL